MLKKLALAALLASPALASASPYLIMGAASGSADLADVEATFPGATSADDGFTRALVGAGVSLSPNVAVEGIYMTEIEGEVKDATTTDTLKSSALQFALLGQAPLAAQLSLFGKISANYVQVEYESVTGPVSGSVDDDKFQVGFGAGLQFQASDMVGLRLGFERIQVRDAINGAGDSDIDQASVSVLFSF